MRYRKGHFSFRFHRTAMAFSLHHHWLCRILGLVGRHVHDVRSIDRRCTQPDWHAADRQFSLLFFLWLLSDKRGVEISQSLHQIVELISRIEGLLQSWSSTTLQVTSVCAGSFQKIVAAKIDLSTSKYTLSKRQCQSAVDLNPERPH